jgi:hypothetical protein
VADLTSTPTNGNHHVSQPGDGSPDAAVIETPDAAPADAIRRDPFSADWRQNGEQATPAATESGPPDRAEDEPPAAAPDSWFTPRETPDREQTWDAEPSPGAADAWFTPRERPDGGRAPSPPAEPPQEHAGSAAAEIVTGFWTPSAAASAPTAEGHAITRASWPAPAEPSASDTPAVPPRTISGPAVPAGPVVPPSRSRSDRLYPVRLLVVIVVAALIGSILVLLLR